jgi:hypothetical protein
VLERFFQIFFFTFFGVFVLSVSAGTPNKKQAVAARTKIQPKIDGIPDEACWQNAISLSGFTQRQIHTGKAATQHTEVKIMYDDVALYIAAIMFDVAADSILHEIGERDQSNSNSDQFGIYIDTYNDAINAFGFIVNAAGVQTDIRYSPNGEDYLWNAVWDSKVKIDSTNWYAEIKIPYSALRFPNSKVQTWGINFMRGIRRHREISYWNFVDPANEGFVNQFGILTGIENIVSPIRLSLTPYVSAYADHYKTPSGITVNQTFNAGTDIKYGINESFTLDMTLVPDFGQVQSDNLVLNLSPFEIQFNEFRPFFTEGTELFNRGGLFYSRRVGGTPKDFYSVNSKIDSTETLVNNPLSSQLINATKLSGRTNKGLGIGIFNATTSPSYATVQNISGESRNVQTDPLTNYSVMVFDQSLKNNSYISIINTNVMREGSYYDANVSATQFKIADQSNSFAFTGFTAISQLYLPNKAADLGHNIRINSGKISGNNQYGISFRSLSNRYNPRDLGFLLNNNTNDYEAYYAYKIFKPFWKLNGINNTLKVTYTRLYVPDKFQFLNIALSSSTTITRYFFSNGINANVRPINTYDFFEPRINGRFFIIPANTSASYWYSSDYRKIFALDGTFAFKWFEKSSRNEFSYSISPRVRATNKVLLIHEFYSENKLHDEGVALNPNGSVVLNNDTSIFGIRNVHTITNTFNVRYSLTNRMALTFRVRHYWSKAIYSNFKYLGNDGFLYDTDYVGNNNLNFNAFNVDMVYVWNFSPGSEMRIVWKNTITDLSQLTDYNYTQNLENTIEGPQLNSLSIKVLYYLDYLMLKPHKKQA